MQNRTARKNHNTIEGLLIMEKKSILSKKSQKLIDKVIALLSIPVNQKYYNQGVFKEVSPLDTENYKKYIDGGFNYTDELWHKCETECCIAGWLVYAKSQKLYKETTDWEMGIVAKQLLTLENGEHAITCDLFDGNAATAWPKGFRKDSRSSNSKVKARNAIKALKHYKANVTEDGWK
jgi:hypothetical protein